MIIKEARSNPSIIAFNNFMYILKENQENKALD